MYPHWYTMKRNQIKYFIVKIMCLNYIQYWVVLPSVRPKSNMNIRNTNYVSELNRVQLNNPKPMGHHLAVIKRFKVINLTSNTNPKICLFLFVHWKWNYCNSFPFFSFHREVVWLKCPPTGSLYPQISYWFPLFLVGYESINIWLRYVSCFDERGVCVRRYWRFCYRKIL